MTNSRIILLFEAIKTYKNRLHNIPLGTDIAKWNHVIEIYNKLYNEDFVNIWNIAAEKICNTRLEKPDVNVDIEMLIIDSLDNGQYTTHITEIIELLITDPELLQRHSTSITSYVPDGQLLLLRNSDSTPLKNVTFPNHTEIITINGKTYKMVGIVWGDGSHYVAEINIIIPSKNRDAGLYLCNDSVTTKIDHWRCEAVINNIPKLIMLEQVPVGSGGSPQSGKQTTILTKHNQKNKSKNKSKNKTRRIRN